MPIVANNRVLVLATAACCACGTELRPGVGTSDYSADAGTGDDVASLPWPADRPLPDQLDMPPWLTMPEPGRIVVGWRTVDPSTGWVRVSRRNEQWVVTSPERTELHAVDLGVLAPGTAYRYEVIVDDTDVRREGVFVTPGADRVRLVHLAEFHAPSNAEQAARFAAAIRAFQPQLVVESGDMTDSGANFDHWRSYLRASAPWISNVILLPAHSNHVNGFGGNANLLDLFALPNNERWYATRFGPVEIITVDSTYDRDNPDVPLEQIDWLAQTTAAAHDGDDDPSFLVAAWHYPACSSHYASRASEREWVMYDFVDTLEANGGADLALVGHDKYYERSVIDGKLVHVMTNAGRLAPGSAGNNHPRCTPIRTNTVTRSLALIEVTPGALTATVIDDDGRRLDGFSIDENESSP